MQESILRDPRVGITGLSCAIGVGFCVSALSPFMAAATFSYSCLVVGLLARPIDRRLHAACMSLGMIIDLMIVLLLELNRDAIRTALGFSLSPLQQIHIAASSVATVLYIPTLVLGFMRLNDRGGPAVRRYHRRLGVLAFAFRTVGFFLMFSLLWKTD